MPVLGFCRNLHSNLCPCFVCGKKFSLDNGVEDLLTHVCFTHRIVVENIESIADFEKYMEYYFKRLREAPMESFSKSFVIEVPEKDSAPRQQKYYVLGNSKEDEELRKCLHAKRLKAAQRQQKKDLSRQYYQRHCFYCHQTIEVTNAQFIHHLRSHGFYLGHPEKLVYIERFVEAIEDKFRNMQCLYCDIKFDSCRALVKHMVDKNHQKIHSNNRFYDQFYIINYLEYGKTWLDFSKNKEGDTELDRENIDEDEDWSCWDSEPESITCLFCEHICRSWEGALLHMQVSHNFDFKAEISPLKFYHQVKVINYIRRRIADKICINCDFTSENNGEIVSHMDVNNHLHIPDKKMWNELSYYMPTLENDTLLFHLEDDELDNESEDLMFPVKEKSEILRHIDITNSECESTSSTCDDFGASDSRELEEKSLESEKKENDLELSTKNVFVEIKHWRKDAANCSIDDMNCSVTYDLELAGQKSSKPFISTTHSGGGDSASKMSSANKFTNVPMVCEFGDAGQKGHS